LDLFSGRQVAKIRQKIKRTGTTIHQNIENKKSMVVAYVAFPWFPITKSLGDFFFQIL
jgi:hypothetical protein